MAAILCAVALQGKGPYEGLPLNFKNTLCPLLKKFFAALSLIRIIKLQSGEVSYLVNDFQYHVNYCC